MALLTLAAIANTPEVIKVLLQIKANSKAIDSIGCHAAYMAAYCGNLDALKILIEKDGDLIDLKGLKGETPLIAASILGNVDVVKYLVEEKANANLKDNEGKTALQHANDPEIIEILTKEDIRI